ncbi:MAG: sigma-54-dependent Fis family transcriptional regulator [Sedimentisphaerales bacterium]|nr:sigma-54-dependent Fis family transcriptional regulator [Sedimentisphaerales bacterium]
MLFRVLLAIRNAGLRQQISKSLPDALFETVSTSKLFWEHFAHVNVDCIVIDRALLPSPEIQSITHLLQLPDIPAVIVLSDKEDPEGRAHLLAAGCEAMLNSKLPPQTLCETLAMILDRIRMKKVENFTQRRATAQSRLSDFVSNSPAMQAFMHVVYRVAGSDAPLLIQGETGVGKERLARAIHVESPRSNRPFIAVNCGALPESLLESELFGHKEGAFTGATRSRRGCFELAHRGTIFLDEITEMPVHLQVKLLRVLQEYEIQPVGAEKSIKIDVRLMASTNRNLDEEIKHGRFRKDLYYRLSVVSLTVPPLRERREDIPALVHSHIAFLRPRIGGGRAIDPEAMAALIRYSWPGNVRELINVIERAMLLCNTEMITLADLPESISGTMSPTPRPSHSMLDVLAPMTEDSEFLRKHPWRTVRRTFLDRLEREYLRQLLESTNGHIGRTAKLADMRSRSLFDKMKKHGLRKEDFKG